ncbi:MAG: molybdenum cofactor biosynthesis protein MoaB [Planctomycetes bacterium]|nr:molybdenum cofactor biosynthesis protein MoaB [Planctomycetota bacterium]
MSNPFQSHSAEQHRQDSPTKVRCAVITVSDTRSLKTDSSGQAIVDSLEEAGHEVTERAIVPDDPTRIDPLVQRLAQSSEVEAILLTGGTGIAARDQTPDTLAKMLTKELPGYGELLRMLSYQEIGPAAMLSRAFGGLIGETVLLTMPGSTAAVRLAMEKLILPELGHMVSLAKR